MATGDCCTIDDNHRDKSDIKDPKLAPGGKKRIMWADRDMPVLAADSRSL